MIPWGTQKLGSFCPQPFRVKSKDEAAFSWGTQIASSQFQKHLILVWKWKRRSSLPSRLGQSCLQEDGASYRQGWAAG